MVEVEFGVGTGGELLHSHSDLVLADVPVLGQTVDERQQQLEVGRAHTAGRVQHEHDVGLGAAGCRDRNIWNG